MLPILALVLVIIIILIWFTKPKNGKTIVIVGGGIAGLLMAYRLGKNPENKIVLLEKERLGGRAYQIVWHDTEIDYGAGVIRERDKKAQALCKELGIKLYHSNTDLGWKSNIPQLTNPELEKLVKEIKNKYEETKNESYKLTFLAFLQKYFPTQTDQIIKHLAYTDMLDAAVWDTIYNYPLTDMLLADRPYYWPEGGPGAIPAKLIENLNRMSNVKIVMTSAEKIKLLGNKIEVYTDDRTWLADKVILAVTLHPLKQLLANSGLQVPEINGIGNVEFIRGFSYHAEPLPKMPGFVVTDTMNQRIIKINDHVLMNIYADNNYAKYWKNKTDDEILKEATNNINKDFNFNIDAQDFTKKYWIDGIHYYKPGVQDRAAFLKKLHKPFNSELYIIGEMVSINQGWMEGAIESTILSFPESLHQSGT